MHNNHVWIVTGTTTGVGYVLVRRLLDQGYQVAATSRTKERLIDIFGPETDQFLPLSITNLADEDQIIAAKEAVLAKFGTVDVVVNNAGMAYCGAVEETSDKEARELFDVNFFGSLNMIRQFLPVLREKRSGYFLNINSDCGIAAHMDGGLYSASKHAQDAISKVVSQELEPLGVRSVSVHIANIRSHFNSHQHFTKTVIDDYAHIRTLRDRRGNRSPGNPQKVVDMLLELTTMVNPPIDIILGGSGYRKIKKVLARDVKNLIDWEEVSLGVDVWEDEDQLDGNAVVL